MTQRYGSLSFDLFSLPASISSNKGIIIVYSQEVYDGAVGNPKQLWDA